MAKKKSISTNVTVQDLTKKLFFEREREVFNGLSSRLSASNNKKFLATSERLSTNKISVYVFIQAIFLFIIIVTFRKIRALFPVPQASDSEIVGYAQYYGYPLYFDTFIFFTIMLSPIVICIIIDQFVKWKK